MFRLLEEPGYETPLVNLDRPDRQRRIQEAIIAERLERGPELVWVNTKPPKKRASQSALVLAKLKRP